MIDARIDLIQKFISQTFRYNSGIKDFILPGDSPHPVPVGLQSVRGPPRVPRLLHGLVPLNSNLKQNILLKSQALNN